MITMPTAREVFPPGTPKPVCEDFNRRRKSFITAMELFREHGGNLTEADVVALTDTEMAHAAQCAGVKVPGGTETRRLIRAELRKLADLPPQPDPLSHAAAPVRTNPAATLAPEQLTGLLALGIPVLLVPVRAA
ncbi:hypothetical protein [Streptomyces yaizuensis]|uniref:Uncharacterized protein n=1 Tax=Streptomyces yaizuensis TaxID=2989713 RepID=A0ABQ5P640_9ACTN|nr:hypothetical protein [Streptomyces sp. YSPA8]GLF98058.1 hypothetical protein SYYSPA8_27195 [Streptomyces sp. YSPA8]